MRSRSRNVDISSLQSCVVVGHLLLPKCNILLLRNAQFLDKAKTIYVCSVPVMSLIQYRIFCFVFGNRRLTEGRKTGRKEGFSADDTGSIYTPDSQTATSVSQCLPRYPGGHEQV